MTSLNAKLMIMKLNVVLLNFKFDFFCGIPFDNQNEEANISSH